MTLRHWTFDSRRFEWAYAYIVRSLETPCHWVVVPDISKERNAFIFKGLETPRHWVMVPDVSKGRKFLIFKGLEKPRHWVMVSHVSKEGNAFIFEGLETWRQQVMVLDASKERLETPCHWIIDSRHFEDTNRRMESSTTLSWTRRILATPMCLWRTFRWFLR